MSILPIGYSCSKSFEDYPCSHRQWKHPGHCKFIHGYSRSFVFFFTATHLDKYGFVVDFSSLKPLKSKLTHQFDHTFLVNYDDPLLETWVKLHDSKALDLRVMENVGMEFTAELIWRWANELLIERDKGRTCCWRTTARENNTNEASYESIPDWFEDKKPLLKEN